MPVRKITEQQFRTRRKDRKMVWVDAAALLVGLLVLSVSVGGIIVLEPEVEPIEWEYSFTEGKVNQKWCYGTLGTREGCVGRTLHPSAPAPEGQPIEFLMHPLEAPNVTRVVVRLTWTDDIPEDKKKEGDPDVKYTYDNNSTDTLRLEVLSPWGENWTAESTNDIELRNGLVEIAINLTEPPEGGKVKAMTKKEVQEALAAEHTMRDHQAIGQWTITVTVVRAGDQIGSVPIDACADVPGPVREQFPEDVEEECYLDDNQNENEAYATTAPQYRGSYDDVGNRWVMEFSARTYSASVTF